MSSDSLSADPAFPFKEQGLVRNVCNMGSVLGFDTQMDQVDGCVVIGNFLGSLM